MGKADGKQKWADAKPYTERRMAKNQKSYNVHQFRDFYIDSYGEEGWVEKWRKADWEQRQASDGKWYSWRKFVKLYGLSDAFVKWYSAWESRAEKMVGEHGQAVSGCQCKGK